MWRHFRPTPRLFPDAFALPRSSLLITVDRLNPSFLGPYGGTSAATPNFNRLAAQSLVMEYAISDAADLALVLRSYWQGVHACAAPERSVSPGVLQLLETAHVRTTLVSDDPAVVAHPLAESFHERVQLPDSPSSSCAAAAEETQLAQSLAAALEILAEQRAPFHLHLHLQGLAGPWDAPLDLRETLRGEDDPEPRDDASGPALRLEPDYDPDLLVGITQAYAAQVMLLDMALGVLLDAVDGHSARDELLLIVTAPRGFPLGEHLIVGQAETALYGELLHVPLLVRRGDKLGALARDHALVQPADISATLAEWFDLPRPPPSPQASSLLARTMPSPAPWPREQTLSIADGQRATRTSAWFLRQTMRSAENAAGDHDLNTSELFSKPDDRYEANEISSLCPLIAEQLAARMAHVELAHAANDFTPVEPLPPELVDGMEAF